MMDGNRRNSPSFQLFPKTIMNSNFFSLKPWLLIVPVSLALSVAQAESPQIALVCDQQGAVGSSAWLNVWGSDAEGDAFTYSATGLPAGLQINPTTGVISGIIQPGAIGGQVTITVTQTGSPLSSFTSFRWSVESTAGLQNGLRGEYFSNNQLSGLPVMVRTDGQLKFEWQGASPGPLVPIDQFSARWTGNILPQYTEDYTFVIAGDDGVRVWINGVPLVNTLTSNTAGTYEVTVPLVANQPTPIRVEYAEGYGWASIYLAWYSTSQNWEVVPAASLSPTTPSAAQTNSPGTAALMAALTNSLAFEANGPQDFDYYFRRPWQLGCTHYTVIEASYNLMDWTDVSSLAEHRDTFYAGTVDELRLPHVEVNSASYYGPPGPALSRSFFRVRYVPIAGYTP
jgi:hypothetical protein